MHVLIVTGFFYSIFNTSKHVGCTHLSEENLVHVDRGEFLGDSNLGDLGIEIEI